MPVKKTTTKKVPIKPKDTRVFGKLIDKYENKSYDYGGRKIFKVETQLHILQEYCETTGCSYDIDIFNIDVSIVHRTIGVKISIYDKNHNLIRSGSGVSTRAAYEFEILVKDAATEATQTVAIGKALSLLGITLDGALYSKDEIEIFENNKKLDLANMKSKAIKLVGQLPEDLKTKIRKYDKLSATDIMSMVNLEDETIESLSKKIELIIASDK